VRTDGRKPWWRITAAVALVLTGLLSAAGCGTPGRLHDDGRAPAVASHPSPQALWADSPTTTAPAGTAPVRQPPPSAVPGVIAPSGDIQAVSVTKLLDRDPALERDEREALNRCPACDLRPPRYRDLTGDGRPELITAVVTPADRAVLHVYTLRRDRLVPVLDLPISSHFTADTVGLDLVVQEPTTASLETSSRYHWDGTRLAFTTRQIKATGPGSTVDALACAPGFTATDEPTPSPSVARGTVGRRTQPGTSETPARPVAR
jgi:hypothetical protein